MKDSPSAGESIAPEDATVWLVRMRGSFKAPHGPRDTVDAPPVPGWIYTIIDAETGQTISSGFDPGDHPALSDR